MDFYDDVEKMKDFEELSKHEFLNMYSYLTDEEYENTAKLYYINQLEEIKRKLNIIDTKLFYQTGFKNKKTNFRVHAQNKILSIILDLECLQNGFNEELLNK